MDLFKITLEFTEEVREKLDEETIQWLKRCEQELNVEVNSGIKSKMLGMILERE